MYVNTTYKAFVAEAAAKVAAHLAESKSERDLKNDDVANDIATASVNVAEHLAEKLSEWWQCRGDHSTVMFDVEDSLTSGIERELASITGMLDDIRVAINSINSRKEQSNEEMD